MCDYMSFLLFNTGNYVTANTFSLVLNIKSFLSFQAKAGQKSLPTLATKKKRLSGEREKTANQTKKMFLFSSRFKTLSQSPVLQHGEFNYLKLLQEWTGQGEPELPRITFPKGLRGAVCAKEQH